jgi:succinate dehydrogenase / fumarate reductase membrane anchor subunit
MPLGHVGTSRAASPWPAPATAICPRLVPLSPLNAVLLAVTLVVSVWHMQMGLKVIVDDYIHKPGSRGLLLGLIGLLCVLIAAAGVFFIVRLALGSAPLPAGFGI